MSDFSSRSSSTLQALPLQLQTAPDEELFKNNVGIDRGLQLELKRQLLVALSWSGLLRETREGSPAVRLEEITLLKARESSLSVDVDTQGGVRTKENAGENERPAIGAQFATHYYLKNSTYAVSFTFLDRNNGVHRLALREPLTVEEKLKVESKVKLDVSMLRVLPANVGKIVARFFDDIGASVDAGLTWERTSALSVRMFYQPNSGATELVRDYVSDVAMPLCRSVAASLGFSAGSCDVALPPTGDPVAELEGRLAPKLRAVSRCDKTSQLELAMPVYVLATRVAVPNPNWAEGRRVFIYQKANGGWKKLGWATVLGPDQSGRCGRVPAGEACLSVKYGAHWFEGTCSASHLLALSERDAPFFYQ